MSSKIDSCVNAPAAASPVRPVSRSRDGEGAAASSSRQGSGDSVALTSDAQALQALDGRIRADSGVDSAKVAEIRRSLAEGRYVVDPEAIASKLVQFEDSLQKK